MPHRPRTHRRILQTIRTKRREELTLFRDTTNTQTYIIRMQSPPSTPPSPGIGARRIEVLLGTEKGIRRLARFLKASQAYEKRKTPRTTEVEAEEEGRGPRTIG